MARSVSTIQRTIGEQNLFNIAYQMLFISSKVRSTAEVIASTIQRTIGEQNLFNIAYQMLFISSKVRSTAEVIAILLFGRKYQIVM